VAESELNKLHHSGTDKRTHILRAYDTYTHKDIVLKVFEDEASAVREHGNLDRLRSRQVVAVFGDVISMAHGGSTYYGVAMERGEEDVRAYIDKFPDLTASERKTIGEKIIQAVQLVHECGLVWHDCKPSNFVRCHIDGRNYIKAIDVEHALAEGSQMTPAHGHTVRFAAPEVVRGCEGLRSSFSMDMWSLGVTLLFVAKGRDLADVLFPSDIGEEGTDRLSRLYSTQSGEDLQRTIDSALDMTFTEQESHLKSLIGHLLKVEVSERYSMSQVVSHAFVTGGHGTITEEKLNIAEDIKEMKKNQDEMKENQEELLRRQARTEAAIDSLKTELNTKMMSGQLPLEDMMAFTQQLAALQTNPSSDDLQAIKDQLQEIFDRVSE
jgi:serine/threonine protein kinase